VEWNVGLFSLNVFCKVVVAIHLRFFCLGFPQVCGNRFEGFPGREISAELNVHVLQNLNVQLPELAEFVVRFITANVADTIPDNHARSQYVLVSSPHLLLSKNSSLLGGPTIKKNYIPPSVAQQLEGRNII
jgi:hypothetical protein